ncbi:Selenoprotein P [Mactra antiquata]
MQFNLNTLITSIDTDQARDVRFEVLNFYSSNVEVVSAASGLEHIKTQLRRQNIHDIQFLIVNDRAQHAIDNVGELARRVSFPVYQDTNRNNIWSSLGGGKDDVFIYDRCGLLTEHIPYPRSLLNRRDFQAALWQAYFSNPCDCTPTDPPSTSSDSQPETAHGHGHSHQGNGHQGQRGHRARSHQGHGHHSHHHGPQQDDRNGRPGRHYRDTSFVRALFGQK